MKKTDAKLISNLRADGRMPLTSLSKKVGLPVSTLHERLKKVVSKGVGRPSLLLDFPKLGYSARAFILLAVEHSEKEKLLAHLAKSQYVNSLFRINNGWSALMECVFKDLVALETFIERLENAFQIKRKETYYVLDEVKRESFLNDANLAEDLLG